MKADATKCDRCGVVSEHVDYWSKVTIKYLGNGELTKFDLCPDCAKTIRDTINEGE